LNWDLFGLDLAVAFPTSGLPMETPASGSRFLLLYDASVRQAPA
jgi:hypothetical protein